MNAKLINELLDKRVKELAVRGGEDTGIARSQQVLQALGLDPLPPRTDLQARVTGILERDGYRLEKIRYEARPGELVTAHLYLPQTPGPHPVVLNPHGHWEFKKSTPWVQARGISLALAGFAALIIDSPGYSWDDNRFNERRGMGPHDDFFLCMGAPVQGIYTWDIMRGLDYLETRPECDTERVGITGCSGGGTATMWAFAADHRIKVAVPVCYIASFENSTTQGCLCNHVPGFLRIGDRNDVLATRAPAPVMIIGATVDEDFPLEGTKLAFEKLNKVYKDKKCDHDLRLVIEESGHDYNRRMREAMLAFFREHLMGEARAAHFAELRPLTDGSNRPYPAGTEPHDDEALLVLPTHERQTITMRDILRKSLAEPYPQEYDVVRRLVRWTKFGKIEPIGSGAILALHDEDIAEPKEPGSCALPTQGIELRNAIYIGMSLPELYAQILHVSLPGAPEDWETSSVLGADAITSMIASVKTLVTLTHPENAPKMVVAQGPVSSMTARFLKIFRPDLAIETSHHFSSWTDILDSDLPVLTQPGARYLEFPSV